MIRFDVPRRATVHHPAFSDTLVRGPGRDYGTFDLGRSRTPAMFRRPGCRVRDMWDRGARMPRSEAGLVAAVLTDVSLDGVQRCVAIDLHPCGTDEMLVLRF